MNRIYTITVILFLAVTWSASTPAAESDAGVFRVVFMNLKNYAEPSSTDIKSDESRRAVWRTLAAADAEIMVLCEVGDRSAMNEIAEGVAKLNSGARYVYRRMIQSQDEVRHLTVLARRKPVVEDHRENTTYSLRNRTVRVRRGYAHCVFEWPGDYQLHVVAGHLKSKVYHFLGQTDIRRYEARHLRYLVDDILKEKPDANILVLGDFNDTMNTSPLKTLYSRRKSDIRQLFDLRPTDEYGMSWTHWWDQADDYARIDYALASYHILPEIMHAQNRLSFLADWHLASDHRAVIVSIKPVEKEATDSFLTDFSRNIYYNSN